MVPTSFEESNCILSAPKGMEDRCEAICVLRCQLQPSGDPAVVSCYKMTAEELAEVNRTGRIWLLVIGETMPPVSLSGFKPPMREAEVS